MPEGCVVSGVPPEAAPGVGAVGYKTNWHDICLKNTPENKLAWSMPKKYARKTLSYIYIYICIYICRIAFAYQYINSKLFFGLE